jgi:hypothetical protein
MTEVAEGALDLLDWRRFGPNGRAVCALLERARQLTDEEAEALIAAQRQARGQALAPIDQAVARSGRKDVPQSLRAACAVVGGSRRKVEHVALVGVLTEHANHRYVLSSTVYLASIALALRDMLTRDEFGWLYGVWQEVIGQPRID